MNIGEFIEVVEIEVLPEEQRPIPIPATPPAERPVPVSVPAEQPETVEVEQ